jgi:hypothetical protein
MSRLDGIIPYPTWDGGEESRITALMRRNRDLETTLQNIDALALDVDIDTEVALHEIHVLAEGALKRGKP